jgi:site-specific DNA-cytosine methylase
MAFSAFSVLPIPMLELIRTYDITSSSMRPSTRANVLVSGVRSNNDFSISGLLKDPNLHDHRFMTWHTEKPATFDMTDRAVELTTSRFQLMRNVSDLYCHNVVVTQIDPLKLHADSQSLLIPWNNEVWTEFPSKWTLEQFSGGFGGWSFGLRYLESQIEACEAPHRILGIESNLPYATQYALSHGSCLIGNPHDMPTNFISQLDRNAVIVTRIQELCWQHQLQHMPTHLWTVSAPCVSWTTAASQEGFWSPDGLALAHAIAQLRIFKPQVATLEQVSGFEGHTQFGLATRMLTWAGYHMIHSGIFDLSNVTPCRRARWLGILVHVDQLPKLNMEQPTAFRWPSVHSTARSFDAIRPMSAEEALEFEPSVPVASMYFDPNFLPGRHTVWTKKQILDYRIPSIDGKIPTFMSRYGQQHTFRPYQLTTKGLFGHFLRSGMTFRFWSPAEIALLHAQAFPMIILKPKTLGWETLGKCISTPHAIFALAHALNARDNLHINPTQMVQNFIHNRFKISNSAIQQDQFAWYLGPPNQVTILKQRLQFFTTQLEWTEDAQNTWPAGTFFSPVDGLLPLDWQKEDHANIPETISESSQPASDDPIEDVASQPDQDLLVMPKLIPGEYGTIKVSPCVKARTLLTVWEQPLSPTDQDIQHIDQPINQAGLHPRTVLRPLKDQPQDHSLRAALDTAPKDTVIPILHRSDVDLSLYEVVDGSTWRQIRTWHPQLSTAKHDIFGDLHDACVFHGRVEVSDRPYEPIRPVLSESQIFALERAEFTTLVPKNTDILILHCTGDGEARQAFLRCWMSEQQMTWYHQIGRQCNFQLIDDYSWRLIFRPHHDNPTMPVPFFKEALTWRIWKQCLASLQTNSGYDTIIKRLSKVIIRCNFAASTPIAAFLVLFKHVYQIYGEGQPSMIASGKRCTEPATVRDLFDRLPKSGPIIIHISPPMSGGGEQNATQLPSKMQFE